MELSDEIYNKITALSEEGDVYAGKEQFGSAISVYQQALDLLPSPKTNWEAATWLYVALADAYFNKQEFNQAMDAYQKALMCPDGTMNPYVWFSIGLVYFEWDNMPQAKEQFMRAYMLDGKDIFEDQDPAYFALIKEEAEKESTDEEKE